MLSEEEIKMSGGIILRMVDENGIDFDFIVELDQPFGPIRVLHEKKLGLAFDKQLAFFYNGSFISDEDTARRLDMEWDDVLESKVIERPKPNKASKKDNSNKKHVIIKPEEMEGYIGDQSVEQICAIVLAESKSGKSICQTNGKKKKNKRKNKANKRLPKAAETETGYIEGHSADVVAGQLDKESDLDEFFDTKSEFDENIKIGIMDDSEPSKMDTDNNITAEMSVESSQEIEKIGQEIEDENSLTTTGEDFIPKEKLEKLIEQNDISADDSDKIQNPVEQRIGKSKQILMTMKDVKHEDYKIEEDSTGYSYESIFYRCFDEDVKIIRVVDPWMAVKHQFDNFKYFCALAARECINLKKICLVTRPVLCNSFNNQIEKIKSQHKIELPVEFHPFQHDREITFDNGWTVKIDRGLDIYKKPDLNERNSTADMVYSQRKCKYTAVDIFYFRERIN